MTECGWCGRGLPERVGPGRPRRFCRDGCKQRAFEARAADAERRRLEASVVAAREELAAVEDGLALLAAAVGDVDRLRRRAGRSLDRRDLEDAVGWLLDAARPLVKAG